MPSPPPVDPARDHLRGPQGAPVVLLYGDYEDPFTRGACAAVAQLDARLAFRHLPEAGVVAAVAAEAAAELGAFWAMHDVLLRNDGAPAQAGDLRRYAADAGLDADRFEAVFGSDAQMARIREDVRGAAAAGLEEPPALFLGDERLLTYDVASLRERLSRA